MSISLRNLSSQLTDLTESFVYWTWNLAGWSRILGGLDWTLGTPVHIHSGPAGELSSLLLGQATAAAMRVFRLLLAVLIPAFRCSHSASSALAIAISIGRRRRYGIRLGQDAQRLLLHPRRGLTPAHPELPC